MVVILIIVLYRYGEHPNLFVVMCLQFLLLGAVPFPGDVLRLKDVGVRAVVTLNESYETLVPTAMYQVPFHYYLEWMSNLMLQSSVSSNFEHVDLCNIHR